MWMYPVQFMLFCVGLFLPFALLPHPLPPHINERDLGMGAMALGVALAFLGTVGIKHLFSVAAARARKRSADASAEGVAGRVHPTAEHRLLDRVD